MVDNYHKRTPKKRPGKHSSCYGKRIPRRFIFGRKIEKVTIITLLYLTTFGDIKMQSFEVVSGESVSLGITTM